MSNNVLRDQEAFFNLNSRKPKVSIQDDIFYQWANEEQFKSFNWIRGSNKVLEYGCGTGGSLDVLYKLFPNDSFEIVGVDIAEEALNKAKESYPEHSFFRIYDNKIPMLIDNSQDAAFMFHVLHHSTGHSDIFREVFSKLKPGGKFVINDLTSRNPIVGAGRLVFEKFINFFAPKFQEDLVVDGKIPEKYPIDVNKKVLELESVGFNVVEVSRGHLFFFIFHWLDKFFPISRFLIVQQLYKLIISFERKLLTDSFLQAYGEVVVIKALKPMELSSTVLNSGDYSDSFNQKIYDQIHNNKEVLDIGCWTGNLGKEIINNKFCLVDGVEVNLNARNIAIKNGYREVFEINLNGDFNLPEDINHKYDYIVLADILEHLVNPELILRQVRPLLKNDASILISLPNVAFVQNRLNLLLGKWEYRNFGTLDKTHLRFYTINTAIQLVEKCGYVINEVMGYNQFGILKKLGFLSDLWPELFSYQIYIRAQKKYD